MKPTENCNNDFRKLMLLIIFFLLLSRVYAQELLDPLLDIPPPGEQAIEKAKERIGTNQTPIQSTLEPYEIKNETGEVEHILVWNITFGEPDNKIVLIDADTGNVISITPTKKAFDQLFFNPLTMFSFFIVITVIGLIALFFIKRRERLREG